MELLIRQQSLSCEMHAILYNKITMAYSHVCDHKDNSIVLYIWCSYSHLKVYIAIKVAHTQEQAIMVQLYRYSILRTKQGIQIK